MLGMDNGFDRGKTGAATAGIKQGRKRQLPEAAIILGNGRRGSVCWLPVKEAFRV